MLLVGTARFVKDPELTKVGDTVKSSFSLVHNEYYKNSDGEKVNKAHYFDFEVWDSAAEYICKHCKKGDKIFFEATPKQEKWEKDGQTKQRVLFRINKFDVFIYSEQE